MNTDVRSTDAIFAQRMEDLGLMLPEGCAVEILPYSSTTIRARVYNNATEIYGWEAGEIGGFPTGAEFTDKMVRQIVRFARSCDTNWNTICSLDHFLEITGKGKPLETIGFDIAFVNWCSGQGISLEQLVAMMKRWSRTYRTYDDVLEAVRRSWTNMERDLLRSYFPHSYRNMHYVTDQASSELDFFQGSFWGRKALAFDFMLGQQRYQSSNTPTLVVKGEMPEAAWKSLKGKPVNDLVSNPIFGKSQKVLSVQDHGSYRTVTMTQELVPVVTGRDADAPDIALAA